MNKGYRHQNILLVLGLAVSVYLSLLLSPYLEKGVYNFLQNIDEVRLNPLSIEINAFSLKFSAAVLVIYAVAALAYVNRRNNYRYLEEHGSARWGNVRRINRKYAGENASLNKILTDKVRISLYVRKHGRNLNTIVCGGSGSGKTRYYCIPNLMQTNTSFVVLDPKGELLKSTGKLLEKKGYDIKVLDLINMEKSHCYNPFSYLQTDNDIQKLVTNIFRSSNPKDKGNQDPFWDTAASMLLLALVFYLHYEAPPDEQNFSMVMELLRAGIIEDEEKGSLSLLDRLFAELYDENPNHIALKYYRNYRSAGAKTLKSIQITLASKLEKFNLESVSKLTSTDELSLLELGEKKKAIFAIISDTDSSFNFLVSVLYTQMFQSLFYLADYVHGGRLKVPVHFLMDEFANISIPNDFDSILSVMRSRGIFVSIILQNITQLKARFEKEWESIIGNCDTFLYLGGNEETSHKFISKMLGRETIDVRTYTRSMGRNGNYTQNNAVTGRDLMFSSEVRELPEESAILLIRGEEPVMDRKFSLKNHENYRFLGNSSDFYEHGEQVEEEGNIYVYEEYFTDLPEGENSYKSRFVLFSDEEDLRLEEEYEEIIAI